MRIKQTLAMQLASVLCVILLSSCAPPNRAVVVERQVTGVKQEVDQIGGSVVRIVQPGDTLYAIAFASGLDARDLAAWNGLSAESRIQVGQKIRLTKPLNFVAKQPVERAGNKSNHRQTQTVAKPSDTGAGVTRPPVAASPSPTLSTSNQINAWRWPVQGRLLRRFALNRGQQGIDIQAALEQSVIAAAAGEIVYVGNGLKGYGNLIIIKHNDEFLSAYAHNQAVFVKEGQRVAQASVIGSVGLNQRGEAALQFQIRKHGSPIDPLRYLPAKR